MFSIGYQQKFPITFSTEQPFELRNPGGAEVLSLVNDDRVKTFGDFGPMKQQVTNDCFIPIFLLIIGSTSSWQVAWVFTAIETFFAVLWNVITVSLRQSIIPTQLLGRVNSVYRFFAWGSMPIGIFLGGALVSLMQEILSREMALRSTFFVGAILATLLALFAIPRLSTARIEAARS